MVETLLVDEYFNEIKDKVSQIDLSIVNKILRHWRSFQLERTRTRGYSPNSRRVFIIGNGGSCAISEHISTDLNKRCKVKALTLSNNSMQTALTNDYGQDQAFIQWMKINDFNSTDFLVAISSSGKSKNILNAIRYANDCLAYSLSIFGMDGNLDFLSLDKNDYKHYFIHIDSYHYGVIELVSEIILHGIAEELVLE